MTTTTTDFSVRKCRRGRITAAAAPRDQVSSWGSEKKNRFPTPSPFPLIENTAQ